MSEEYGERVFDIPDEPAPQPVQEIPSPAPRPAAPAPSAAPAPRPAIRTAPSESVPQGSANGLSGDWWRALAESCKGRLSPMYRVFLDKCTGVLENGQVIIFAQDEITLSRIDNDRVRGILSEELKRAAGGAMPLILRVGEAPRKDPQENLKNLLAFASKHENIEIK
jgi:hypothetical protein